MPTLPIYNSKQNIKANTAEPLRNEAAQSFKDDQMLLKTGMEITQKWSQANDVMQETEAKAQYQLEATKLQADSLSDPDTGSIDKYKKALDEAKNRSLEKISNAEIRNKTSAELDYYNGLSAMKIDLGFKKRQLEQNKENLGVNIAGLKNMLLSAMTEGEKADIQSRINRLRNDSIQSLVVSEAEMNDIDYKATYKSAEAMVYASPEAAIDKLQKENLGLGEKDKYKLIEDANQIIKKRADLADWQLKQTQTKSTVDLSEALSNNTLTPMMVRDMQQKGLIDSETAAIFDSIALKKNYEIPESTSLAEPDYFIRLLEDSMGEKSQVKQVMSDAAKAYADHKIGTNQYLYFVQNAKKTFDRQSKGDFSKSGEQNAVMSALRGITSFAKTFSSNAKEMIGGFFNRFKEGEDPEKIKGEIINEALSQQIETSKKTLPKSTVRMVTPDERLIDVDADKVDAAIKRGLKNAR